MPLPTRILVLTGTNLRHDFLRKALALSEEVEVVRSLCEETRDAPLQRLAPAQEGGALQAAHLAARDRSEEDFFGPFVRLTPDHSRPVFLAKGAVNEPALLDEVRALAPDLVVAYGCSILKAPWLEAFPRRILNMHLGLSPYYRGSGTNFWALVNGEPEMVGCTFMYMDAGVDTGEIIHQIRARVAPGDTPHQIGNRLIADMAETCIRIVGRFDRLAPVPPLTAENPRYYRRVDFTPGSVTALYQAFAGGMVESYLDQAEARCARAPIVSNPALELPEGLG